MSRQVDYYFTCVSPWAYLGHSSLLDIAAKHGAEIAFKPVALGDVWDVSGSVPLAKRSPTRQRYRNIELQRYSELRRLPLNLKPRFFPVDPTLADHCVIVLVEAGRNPARFVLDVLSGLWAREEDIADADTLERHLSAGGHDALAILDRAAAADIAATRAKNSKEAIAADAIGVPAYVLNGEVFWGQDRLDMLDRALASGRPPYRA